MIVYITNGNNANSFTVSINKIFLALASFSFFYIYFIDLVRYYFTYSWAGILIISILTIFLAFSRLYVSKVALIIFISFLVINLMSLFLSVYSEKYLYFFYRMMPAIIAYGLATVIPLNKMGKYVKYGLWLIVSVGFLEILFGKDFFDAGHEGFIYFMDFQLNRINSIYWYSLVYSSVLIVSMLFLLRLKQLTISMAIVTLIVLFFTFNRMNILLGTIILLYLIFKNGGKVFWCIVAPLSVFIFVLLIFFTDYFESAFDLSSAANQQRLQFWGMAVDYYQSNDFLGYIFGGNLGVYPEVGNGFESQYLQFLVEYGALGVFFFILFFLFLLLKRNYFISFVILLGLVTMRWFDSYTSAFLLFLLLFTIDKTHIASKNETTVT